MLYVVMFLGTVILMLVLLLRMSSTAVNMNREYTGTVRQLSGKQESLCFVEEHFAARLYTK
jgi:hypothetical protein